MDTPVLPIISKERKLDNNLKTSIIFQQLMCFCCSLACSHPSIGLLLHLFAPLQPLVINPVMARSNSNAANAHQRQLVGPAKEKRILVEIKGPFPLMEVKPKMIFQQLKCIFIDVSLLIWIMKACFRAVAKNIGHLTLLQPCIILRTASLKRCSFGAKDWSNYQRDNSKIKNA